MPKEAPAEVCSHQNCNCHDHDHHHAPLGSPSRKISGAIAAGCSIVVKAAEETPGAACAYVQCFADAGLPPGVLNLVFGDPAQVSAHLIASPVIRVITFTGSIAVGKHLTQLAAKEMKPAIMELGGHAPVIVCDDVDPVRVGHLAGAAKFRMAGQICVSPTRFIVHEAIYAPFVKAFAEAAGALKVGDGMAGGVQMGPMANGRRLAAIEELVEEAVLSEFTAIADRGGVLGAMETGYQRGKIQDESMTYEMLKHTGELPIIGVNTFRNPHGDAVLDKLELARSTDDEKQSQLKRLQDFHARHAAAAPAQLKRLQQAVIENKNVFEVLMDAVRVCSLGQITNALFEVGGQYRRNM